MDPQYNQPPQQPAYTGNSLEYLNQISSNKPPAAAFLNKKMLVIVGAVVVLIIIVIAVVVGSSKPTSPTSQILGQRIVGLNELVLYSATNPINDSSLNKAVAETKVVALSEQFRISQLVALPAAAKGGTAESTETIAGLDKSVSTGNFNKNYADALVLQIEKIEAALLEIRSESTSRTTINEIDDIIAEYDTMIGRLTNY